MTIWPLAIAVCCREWLVDSSSRIGRCGFCGERPIVVGWDDQPPVVVAPPIVQREVVE